MQFRCLALEDPTPRRRGWSLAAIGLAAVLGALPGCGGQADLASPRGSGNAAAIAPPRAIPTPTPTPSPGPPSASASATTVSVKPATEEQVKPICSTCHAYTPPALFPKEDWRREVPRAFEFMRMAGDVPDSPSLMSVTAFFVEHAPAELPVDPPGSSVTPSHIQFDPVKIDVRQALGKTEAFSLSNIRLVRLGKDQPLTALASDMMGDRLLAVNPREPRQAARVLSRGVGFPAHAEVVDLDQDGLEDLLVADLGSPEPTNRAVGRVLWLKAKGLGKPGEPSYEIITLDEGRGRVADVQAADFDGDGDLDLIAAAFGWQTLGEIVYLENVGKQKNAPAFQARSLDPRHGTIHVPICDLNHDGKPDFVALISQEHESVVAFLNEGGGRFRTQMIFQGPHPSFGVSGIQMIDFDQDGDLDVLLSNGDVLDTSNLRGEHGVHLLENSGTYPFRHTLLTRLYGASRAMAGDLDGDGDNDIVASSFLPGKSFASAREKYDLDGLIVLEQIEPGKFSRHSLERKTCRHTSFDLGDVDGDGDLDVVVGNFDLDQIVQEYPPIPPEARSDLELGRIWLNTSRGQAGSGGKVGSHVEPSGLRRGSGEVAKVK